MNQPNSTMQKSLGLFFSLMLRVCKRAEITFKSDWLTTYFAISSLQEIRFSETSERSQREFDVASVSRLTAWSLFIPGFQQREVPIEMVLQKLH